MLTRTLLQNDPFVALSREMDRLFETFAPTGTSAPALVRGQFPMLNIWQTDEEVHVEAELPGFRREDVSVLVFDDELTLKGERRIEHPEEARIVRAERAAGSFERSVRLPVAVDADGTTASFTDGVLHITLPKAAAALPRRIKITSGEQRE